jgi:hypothetical protein
MFRGSWIVDVAEKWFWGNHPRLANYHEPGKYARVLGIVVAIAAHGYFMLM